MEFETSGPSFAGTIIRRTPHSCSPATSTRQRAFDLAERYFGDIPAGEKPQPVHADASLPREIRLVFEDRVELPRVYMAWHSPRCLPRVTPSRISSPISSQTADVATVSLAGVRPARGARRLGVPAFARDRQLLPACGHRRSRPIADGNRGQDRRLHPDGGG